VPLTRTDSKTALIPASLVRSRSFDKSDRSCSTPVKSTLSHISHSELDIRNLNSGSKYDLKMFLYTSKSLCLLKIPNSVNSSNCRRIVLRHDFTWFFKLC